MSFPRYPKYKDSGIPWVGMMPTHWRSLRTKTLFELMKRPPSENDGIITAFRDGKVTLRSNRRTEGFTNSIKEIGYQGIRRGDLVIHAMDAFAGAIGVSDSDGKSTPVYSVCQPKPGLTEARFYGKLLRHMALSGYINSLAKGIRERSTEFRWADAGDVYLPVPPLHEQTTIASFLDRETAKIDALIAEQEKLIALLAEKRQATISHAVTRGLNPNAPLKDSGVAWLGDVPAHWSCKRLRFVVDLNPSKTEIKDIDPDTAVSFLPMESIGDDGSLSLEHTRPIRDVLSGYTYFRNGDVTLAKITPCFENGKGALMRDLHSGFGFGTTELIVMRPNKESITPEFLHWVVYSNIFRKQGEGHMYGAGGQKRVPDDFIRNIIWAIPPLAEQLEISESLSIEISKLNELSNKAKSGINLLNERRSALISAAVTGKIDVRNTVAQICSDEKTEAI